MRAAGGAGSQPRPAVRDARRGDLELLAELGARTFRDAYAALMARDDLEAHIADTFGRDTIAAALGDPTVRVLLAEMDGQVAGYARLQRASSIHAPPPAMQLVNLYVDGCWQGVGAGRALLQASIDAARDSACHVLWLTVWERNAAAVAFYQRHGFHAVGDTPFVVGTDTQRDLVMVREVWPAAT